MSIDTTLFRGLINKEFTASYVFMFEKDGKFQTVVERPNKCYIKQAFGIRLSESFSGPSVFIPSTKYYQFILVLLKSTKLISDNLTDIFPDLGKMEFSIDARTLERFQTEKAVSSAGMTIMPTTWVDSTNTCYPAMRLTTLQNGNIDIPFEDALPMVQMFKTFDPVNYAATMLRFLGRFE